MIRIVDSDDNLVDLNSGSTPNAANVSEFDEVDELIANVKEAPAAVSSVESDPSPVEEQPIPMAEAADEDLVVIDEGVQTASVTGYEQSFEVLDDESDEVIELSDADVIGGLVQPPGVGGPAPVEPVNQIPDYINPAPVQPATPASTPQPVGAAPLSAPGEPTPTSTNPAYRQFGAPPPVLYPAEPPVPDGAQPTVAAPGMAPMGQHVGAPHPALGIVCMITALIAVGFGIWLAASSLSYGRDAFIIGNFASSGKVLGFFMYARLFFAAIFVLASVLFMLNEIIIMAQGGDGIPGVAIFALIASGLVIGAAFFVGSFNLYQNAFGNFSGPIIGDSFVMAFVQAVGICIVPFLMLFVAFLRA
ncbi:MAG: hypothetical protein ACR2NP_07960 [Pirellulaceae bacterium]